MTGPVRRRDTRAHPVTPQERRWAAKSPAYTEGQRVYAYVDNEPGTIVGPDPDFPGKWFVMLDQGHRESIQWDNLATEPE